MTTSNTCVSSWSVSDTRVWRGTIGDRELGAIQVDEFRVVGWPGERGLSLTERAAGQQNVNSPFFIGILDKLLAGVKVVSAPNLFPTPPDVARQVIGLSE